MRRRAVLAGVLAATAARAQDQPAELPPEPAPAPPAPPRLATEGAPLVVPTVPSEPMPPGMAMIPGGAIRFALNSDTLDPPMAHGLLLLGRTFAALPAGRVTVEVQVSGPADDVSMARRASLARAQAVKAALVAGGLAPTRIDLRPLGRIGSGADRVDVLPPGVASPNAEARGR